MGRWLSALALVLGTTGAGVALGAAPACACSCVSQDPAEFAAGADAVFAGTVRGVEQRGGPLTSTAAATFVATIEVDGVHKGNVAEWVEVATASAEASCGVEFQVGERYRVYANTKPSETDPAATAPYYAYLCGGTSRLTAGPGPVGLGVTETAGLGPAKPPRAGAELAPADNLGWALGAGLGAVALLVGLPAGLALRSRRSRAST